MPGSSVPLSVIIPTYNRSQYVRGCLEALGQSGVPDLEIIISDDGSTDDTREVVAAYGPSVQYLWHPNEGTPAPARNRGFAASKGRYVSFLDIDDLWIAGGAARAVEVLDKYPEIDILFGEAQVGNPADGYESWIGMAGQEAFWRLPCKEVEPGVRVLERRPFLRRMAVRNPVFLGACIVRREVFEAIGGFDPALCGAADWELWLRIASRFTYGYLHRPLGVWTQHTANMSSNHDTMNLDFCRALQSVLEKCDLVPDDRRFVGERLRHHSFAYAYRAYDRGDYAEARRRFGDMLRRTGFQLTPALYWAICALPGGLAGQVRRVRQMAGGARSY
jgi:glycosyltransferase involved in cell wall biosynthesis